MLLIYLFISNQSQKSYNAHSHIFLMTRLKYIHHTSTYIYIKKTYKQTPKYNTTTQRIIN